ncbi:MAG: DUF6352 family protein [Hyphomicrobiaceae bacterium]|nr:DUF6352 family protein [Hyphomicrobiaceae bacterium]
MKREFWKSAGLHLLAPAPGGWLAVTPAFLLAYLTRPEIHPVAESCAAEVSLHERLMDDPFRAVTEAELTAIADPDVIDNYRHLIALRDRLADAGTVEGAYLDIVRRGEVALPLVFLDQLVHVILRNALAGVTDPLRLRAAEVLFREQRVSTDDGRIMLADEEIVDMHARTGRMSGLGQLLAESGTPVRQVTLDVLTEANKEIYWDRSDRFDTVIDLRFGEPALDALARVMETWLAHLLGLEVRIEPRPKLEDADWRWHIGLDREATRLLNKLYEGRSPGLEEASRIIGLFRMTILETGRVIERVQGHPVYLALAKSPDDRLHMKPHNLLVNLPLRQAD